MKLKKLLIFPVIIAALYFLGPKPNKPNLSTNLPEIEEDLIKLEKEINSSEKNKPNIKPENKAKIVWYDKKEPTEYSIVYLHGFTASHFEANPFHLELAKKYGCNIYLSRLAEHGIKSNNALLDLTPENLVESAKKAVAIGKKIGKKVILMSTSTGGTLSLYIASGNPDIHSLIMYSPNIDLFDSKSSLLTSPWGLQITRLFLGSKHREFPADEQIKKYWTHRYRVESLIALKSLLNSTMNKDNFSKVSIPVFIGYYYKNEQEQDKVVSVKRINEMYNQISTPENLKVKVEFPNVNTHVIASSLYSKDIESVKKETYEFIENKLKINQKK